MSLQKKIQQKDTDDQVESFGVCSKGTSFNNEQRKFILHLRVHTNHTKSTHPAPAETTDAISSILPDNETYNDLMRYNPNLSSAPVAYEQNSTDSCPLVLVKTANGEVGDAAEVCETGETCKVCETGEASEAYDVANGSVKPLPTMMMQNKTGKHLSGEDTNYTADDRDATASVGIENRKHC